jgi:hypothetical protein
VPSEKAWQGISSIGIGPLTFRHSGGMTEGRPRGVLGRPNCDHNNRILWSQSVTPHAQEGIHLGHARRS